MVWYSSRDREVVTTRWCAARLFTWHTSMCVMEEDLMAISLLYALLGVNDTEALKCIAAKPPPLTKDEERAIKYSKLQPKQKKEVREELYDALYSIVEGYDINRDLNMAIGKALCNAMSGNLQGSLQYDGGVLRLREVLKPIITEAIDET